MNSIYQGERSPLNSDGNRTDDKTKTPDSQDAQAAKRKVECLTSIGNHLEYLIANGLINVREACGPLTHILWNTHVSDDEDGRRERDRFFWRLIPRFEKIDTTIRKGNIFRAVNDAGRNSHDFWSASKQHARWHSVGLDYVLIHAPYRWPDADTNERVLRFFDEAVQSPLPSVTFVYNFLNRVPTSVSLRQLKKQEMLDLFEAMSSRQHEVHQFYGRCGRLGLRLLDPIAKEDVSGLLNEVNQLIDFVKQTDTKDEDQGTQQASIIASLESTRDRIHSNGTDGPWVKKHPFSIQPLPTPLTESRVTFHPLDILAPWLGLKKCTNSLDVAWTNDLVSTIGQSRQPETIFELNDAKDLIYDVEWDGKQFWIATARKLCVISQDGKLLTELPANGPITTADESTFPPIADHSAYLRSWRERPDIHWQSLAAPLQIHCVNPDQCFVMGRMAKEERLWIANVQLIKEETLATRPKVTVIHESIYVPSASSDKWHHATSVFEPRWKSELSINDRRTLLIGRKVTKGMLPLKPLAIDLQSMIASVSSLPSERYAPFTPVTLEKKMLAVDGWGRLVLTKEGADGSWDAVNLSERNTSLKARTPFLLKKDNRIVSPGRRWVAVSQQSENVEILTPAEPPWQYRFHQFAVSAHYGIVGWHRGDRLYQIKVAETKSRQNEFQFVPAEQRDRHMSAVAAIRKHGGAVDAWNHNADLDLNPQGGGQLYSIVFLPAQWTGGDKGLRPIRDLYNPGWLCAIQAPITDEEMKHLDNLKTLRVIRLVETNVTDNGLKSVSTCAELRGLHLEGQASKNGFSDSGLQHLTNLRKLQRLELCGPGFTDAGLASIRGKIRPYYLALVDTRTSPSGRGKMSPFIYQQNILANKFARDEFSFYWPL